MDFIPSKFVAWGAQAYTPSKISGVTLKDPYIAFTEDHAFYTSVPLFWAVGECEAMYHYLLKVCQAFKAIKGNQCELYVEGGAPHDIILLGPMVGFKNEARKTAKAAGRFMESLKR